MNSQSGTRSVDGKAIASLALALVAVVTSEWWLVATLVAVAAIALALASRRSVRNDPQLWGTALSLSGFLIAVGVLLFATVGPSLLAAFLLTIAPPAG